MLPAGPSPRLALPLRLEQALLQVLLLALLDPSRVARARVLPVDWGMEVSGVGLLGFMM